MATSSALKVLITGANRGIGLEFVNQFIKQGAEVWAACRNPSEELEKLNPKKILQGFDVTDEASIQKAMKEVDDDVVFDILLNNAGMAKKDNLDTIDFDYLKKQFDVSKRVPTISQR